MHRQKLFAALLGLILLGMGVFTFAQVRPRAFEITPKPQSTPRIATVAFNSPAPLKVSGFVVPHDDMVSKQREAYFRKVAHSVSPPKTVILLSPNHHEVGNAWVQTTDRTWDVTQGVILANKSVTAALVQNGAGLENESFDNEHGIKLLLGDIKDNFPQATIVPIIFKMKTPKEQVMAVETTLEQSCLDCLMIASVDFSHYQPALLGNLHDTLTERALDNVDTDALFTQAEIDSPSALALFTLWAKAHNTLHFALNLHTNSGELLKDGDIETTTHMFGWYEAGDKVVPASSVSFLIGGDMMFGRMIAHTFLADGLWKSVEPLGERLFWGTDAGIINLEGPVSDKPVADNTASNNLVFNFPPQAIDVLKYLRVNAASQANNHSANAGQAGLDTTRRLLKEASIQGIGGPGDSDVPRVASFTGQGLILKVIGAHVLTSTPDLAPLIKQLKQDPTNRVLIFPHWGVEYVYKHNSKQEALAHAWIDAGADAIIGAHPHVIEDSELYKGKPIIYSMGNLVFDQDFSKETQLGLLVAGKFTDNGLDLFGLPVQAAKYQPSLAKGVTKIEALNQLYRPFAAQRQSTPIGDVLYFSSLTQ